MTGYVKSAPVAFAMAGIAPADVDVFLPYDDYPFIVAMTIEDWGFCDKGDAGRFVEERNLSSTAIFRCRPMAASSRVASPVAPSVALPR